MTSSQRDQLATPVVLVYWLLLVGGLLVFGLTQIDDKASFASFAALWAGAVGGTLVGQCLALRDFRLWIAALVIAVVVAFGAPLVPSLLAGPMLWRAFIPAALCGFWSLGDRTALLAFWFPSVVWMLSVLDRSDATRAPDGTGLALLGALAVLFLVFLRARESRRVGLWRTIGSQPIASSKPPELLREPPARQLARAGWGLAVSAITIAVTGWIAPTLWQRERLPARQPAQRALRAMPCCPVYDVDLERMRVKEYLDLGRGHDARVLRTRDGECRVCPGIPRAGARTVEAWRTGEVDDARAWGVASPVGPGRIATPHARPSAPAVAEGGPTNGEIEIEDAPVPSQAEQPGVAPTDVAAPAGEVAAPVSSPPVATPAVPAPIATPTPPMPQAPTRVPSPPPPAAPRATPPPAAADAPVADDPPPGQTSSSAGPTIASPGSAGARSTPGGSAELIVRWLLWLGIAALVFQLVSLALRPLRRLLTLRHLRHPFWDETVAQQVSNAWQLALIGLRDAGWRPGASEAPQELAKRVSVDGLDRCATILERTRHGIAIDADDLGDMSSSADAVYRAARAGLGTIARAIGWLRWPLT